MSITIKMMGGLGNQMFQYAYAYLLSNNTKDQHVNFDIRTYKKYYWPFNILDFRITNNYSIIDEGKLKYDKSVSLFHIYQKVYEFLRGHKPNYISRHYLKKNYISLLH